MIRGIYTNASGMLTSKRKLETVGNNLANANSNGFKKELLLRKAYPEQELHRTNDQQTELPDAMGHLDKRPPIGDMNSGSAHDGSYTDFSQGSMKRTKNPTDLALEGDGFFVIEGEEQEEFTRDGAFQLNADRELVNTTGERVLGQNGPVTIPQNANMNVTKDGQILNDDGQQLAQLQIAQFENKQALRHREGTQFVATEDANRLQQPEEFAVRQGMTEQSNSNPIKGMLNMIEVSRHYELQTNTLKRQDETLNQSLQMAQG